MAQTVKRLLALQETWVQSLVRELKSCMPCAAAAKSCPTLRDPIDGSPPGSPVPGILQARTLEWVAIAFSSIPCDAVKYETVYSHTLEKQSRWWTVHKLFLTSQIYQEHQLFYLSIPRSFYPQEHRMAGGVPVITSTFSKKYQHHISLIIPRWKGTRKCNLVCLFLR